MYFRPLFGVILTLILGTQFGSTSLAAPQERTQAILSRTLESGQTLRTELSKNLFKQEAYEAEYTVQVPYTVKETYYVDVPYTETVSYTDYEEYYDTEYRCEYVTRYRQQCRDEQVCTPGHRQCQDVTECGIGSNGQHMCKTRRECSDGGRECRNVPQCRQEAYQDRECRNESVRKTRPVTRYREETRYRSEARTRNVTKQRTETRCCVTKQRDVFDRQFIQPVAVEFPAQAVLLAGESEKIQLVLKGSEASADVTTQIKSDVFTYEVESTRMDGREKVFVLKMLPKWSEQNAGATSIQGLKLTFNKGTGAVVFKDNIASPRMVSAYHVQVRDQQSQSLLVDQRLEGNEAKLWTLPAADLVRENKYDISLSVERKGINVTGGALSFAVNAVYEKKELDADEVKLLRSKDQVQLVALQGAGADRVVVIQDQTPAIEEIQSTYKLVVWNRSSNGKLQWLGEKKFTREEIQNADGTLSIPFKAMGLNPAIPRIYFDLVVQRTSPQYLGSQKVQFIVSKTL